MTLSPALQPLLAQKQFILCRLISDGTKANKLPVNPYSLEVCDAHNSANWTSYDEANKQLAVAGQGYLVAFVFTYDDPFFFLDIDNAYNDGQWNEIAQYLCQEFKEAAIEVSQSGKGLHIFGKSDPIEHGCKNKEFGIELYTTDRFVALTDINTTGNVATDYTETLKRIVATYFTKTEKDLIGWRDTPVPEANPIISDDYLIAKALKSKSGTGVFGNKATFHDLWTGDVQALQLAYPPIGEGKVYDQSSADMALAQMLAFWTGKNHARIWDLMWQSQLVRDKWHPDNHKNYLTSTIMNAVGNQDNVYGKRQEQVQTEQTTNELSKDIKISSWGDLSRIYFDEMKWVIYDFLPPGVSLFVGRPKQGKSWLVHGIGLLVAAGRLVFGKISTKSDVLYMALEDSERRLQGRTRKLMKTHDLTDADIQGFQYSIQAPKLGDNLEESLSSVLNDNNNLKLVIIDVLAKIRTGRKGNQSVYEYDYDVGSRLKEVSKNFPDVAFIVVHHQNKGMGDALDSISGTHGLAGGFDNTYALINAGGGMELHINGRDIEDSDPIPLQQGDDGMWTLESRESAADIRNSDTRNKILSALKNGDSKPKEISSTTGIDTNTLNSSLRRMCNQGLINKEGWGKYSLANVPTISDSSHIPPIQTIQN